jgi:hypothetical protein
MLLLHFYNIFEGAQVIGLVEGHGHWVQKLVPYFDVENMATLDHTNT